MGRYELRTGNDFHGKYEVAHYWDDGVTIQVRYFKTRKAAQDYLDEKVSDGEPLLDENGFPMI